MEGERQDAYNPADQQQAYWPLFQSQKADILRALESADAAQLDWDSLGHSARADILDKVADLMERDSAELIGVIATEGGRTLGDGVSEVREAIDFCRYYSLQASSLQARELTPLQGPILQGQGVFLCISPWNFPLAIFVGQIAAALAAGNTVIAKPAAQTPAIAACAVRLFHEAGIPGAALQLLLGSGSQIGKLLVGDSRIAGIAFTGSTYTAQSINQQLAARPGGPIPFIAETGGQNCMIVDSTALPEQVVDDVITSAFQSAGQRCSALRVLFIQEDIADNTLKMLAGAMNSLKAGDPKKLSSDLGPVIDSGAQTELQAHIKRMYKEGIFIAKVELSDSCNNGSFVAPHVFEIDSLDQLTEEVFGPILHVIRYSSEKLSSVIQQINNTGYGLTLGIHSRIEAFAETVYRNTIAGNTYINRNMVGAAVGVNPFGGRGLSGTGPKAGGPNYLLRFSAITQAQEHKNAYPIGLEKAIPEQPKSIDSAVKVITKWQATSIDSRLSIIAKCNAEFLPVIEPIAREKLANPIQLPGPTGEDNKLSAFGRGVMALAITQSDSVAEAEKQIASSLLCGCPVIVAADEAHKASLEITRADYLQAGLTAELLQIEPLESLTALIQNNSIEGLMANSLNKDSSALRQVMAQRSGSIIPLIEWPKNNEGYNYHWLLWFLSERTRTENLVARGGNTQLFNLAE